MNATAAHAPAFDALAEEYDQVFTNSVIGRAQRNAVWEVARKVFRNRDRILELNCGTGEDALFLARAGMSVLACDVSARMIRVATARVQAELPAGDIEFRVLENERLGELRPKAALDGVFSNFSGLNCVQDLSRVARELARLVRPGGNALLCFSSRVCIWEICWFLLHGDARKAFRRLAREGNEAKIGKEKMRVWYPRVQKITRAFAPWFELRGRCAVGLLVPPSYVERWAKEHPAEVRRLSSWDDRLRGFPVLRDCGDHTLFHLQRSKA
ncbi:MAG: class I SAM-dependent methyltransferase [Candidatus Korobacteraceae bacterium]